MVNGEIRGDLRGLADAEKRVREAVRRRIGELAAKLVRNIKKDKLSGAVLRARTGNLRRSVAFRIEEDEAGFSAYVGTGVSYGKVHEYGFQGTVNVREHMRTVRQAYGKNVAAYQQKVSAHSRRVNLPERSFLRSALAEFQAEAERELYETARRAL